MSYIRSRCHMTPESVTLGRDTIFEYCREPFVMNDFFAALYDHLKIDYRRFFKMDALSKLGFLASELLLAHTDREQPKPDMGIILFNKSSSLEADRNYQKTIQNNDNFFPSPSDFVHTLPNIVTGEIAIRNKIYGETAFYVLNHIQTDTFSDIIHAAMHSREMKSVLAGWLEVDPVENMFECYLTLCTLTSGLIQGIMSDTEPEPMPEDGLKEGILLTCETFF